MKLRNFNLTIIGSFFFAVNIFCAVDSNANTNTNSNKIEFSDKADYHAPIGVMRDHLHKKGELMTSYRYSYMKMRGLRNGDDKISDSTAQVNNMVVGKEMTMEMHMLGAMYGVTDKLTVAVMGNIVVKDMDHSHRSNGKFNREVENFGDTKIHALHGFYNKKNHQVQLNLGLSLPTGNINKKYNGARLPYAMQIGSGSYEFLPGLSLSGRADGFSYGGQVNGIFRLDGNENGYKLGDEYNITTWIATNLNENFSISSRLDYNKNEAVEGKDSSLNIAMTPLADPSLQDRQKLDLLFGMNFVVSSGLFSDNKLAVEFGRTIYQRIAGPNLDNDYKITAGWQKVF